MDATQGAWNLEAPEGTGGRLVGASEPQVQELPLARGLTILTIILVSTKMPQVLEQRLVARLLLRLEVSDVGGDEAQVLLTQLHSSADCTEASASQGLVARHRRLARDGRQAAEVQT